MWLMVMFIVTGLSAAAQAPQPVREPQPPLVLKSTTRLVQVSVVATRKGESVSGLTRESFTLTDNGKPQNIALFNVDSSGRLPSVHKPLPPDTYTNRMDETSGVPSNITIILLDALNTRFEDRAYARDQIIKYLKTIQPGDRIGLYTLGRGIKVLHDYTVDSSELLRKLARYSGESLPDLAASEPATDGLSLDEAFGLGGASGPEADFFTVNRVRGTLRAMQFIADHLARVPGRKNLIWVSGGFPLTLGMDNIGEFMDPSRQHLTFTEEISQCVRAMNNANLAIYPVDARGLITPPMFSASVGTVRPGFTRPAPAGVKNQQTMQELAERTGGRAYYNSNDLAAAIRDSVSDSKITYTIGYYPIEDKFDGKFHTIKIKVNEPGVSLRYRKGYFDLPTQPQDDKARRLELHDAAFSPLDATEIGMAVQLQKPEPSRPKAMNILIGIEPQAVSLEHQEKFWAGRLDVLFIQKDERGRQYGGRDDTIELRLTEPNYRKIMTGGLIYRQLVDRAPQATELKIIVRDAASGAIGSVTVPYEKPVHR